jgi:hypothetical protein
MYMIDIALTAEIYLVSARGGSPHTCIPPARAMLLIWNPSWDLPWDPVFGSRMRQYLNRSAVHAGGLE